MTADFLTLTSFGYLHSTPPATAIRVVDVREILRDPARVSGLLDRTGQDPAVRTAVLETPGARPLLHELFVYAATLPPHTPAEIAIGCAGGRHRSVALVEILAEMLHDIGQAPHVRHQHIHLPRVLQQVTSA